MTGDDRENRFEIGAWPNVGIFLVDNLELMLAIGHRSEFQRDDYRGDNISFNLGLRYIFDTRSIVYPLLGASFGTYFSGLSEDQAFVGIVASVPAGILIAINRHIAIDVGLALHYQKVVSGEFGQSPGVFSISLGYLGIEGFF